MKTFMYAVHGVCLSKPDSILSVLISSYRRLNIYWWAEVIKWSKCRAWNRKWLVIRRRD